MFVDVKFYSRVSIVYAKLCEVGGNGCLRVSCTHNSESAKDSYQLFHIVMLCVVFSLIVDSSISVLRFLAICVIDNCKVMLLTVDYNKTR